MSPQALLDVEGYIAACLEMSLESPLGLVQPIVDQARLVLPDLRMEDLHRVQRCPHLSQMAFGASW